MLANYVSGMKKILNRKININCYTTARFSGRGGEVGGSLHIKLLTKILNFNLVFPAFRWYVNVFSFLFYLQIIEDQKQRPKFYTTG